jgi:hypothetical protein
MGAGARGSTVEVASYRWGEAPPLLSAAAGSSGSSGSSSSGGTYALMVMCKGGGSDASHTHGTIATQPPDQEGAEQEEDPLGPMI